MSIRNKIKSFFTRRKIQTSDGMMIKKIKTPSAPAQFKNRMGDLRREIDNL